MFVELEPRQKFTSEIADGVTLRQQVRQQDFKVVIVKDLVCLTALQVLFASSPPTAVPIAH